MIEFCLVATDHIKDKDAFELPPLPRSTTDSAIAQNIQIIYDSQRKTRVDDRYKLYVAD